MANLNIRAVSPDARRFDVAIEWIGDQGDRLTADIQMEYSLDENSAEELRWYLEEFADNPRRYGPEVPAQVVARLEATGDALFEILLDSNEAARAIGHNLRQQVRNTTISVTADPVADWLIPWELLRDPVNGFFFALQARGFFRRFLNEQLQPVLDSIPPRILLIIARPGGAKDIGYRSTAERILAAADAAEAIPLRITTLRPPTFQQLMNELQKANSDGDPYGLVHFDGHGVFDEEAAARFEQRAGFLAFERPDAQIGPDLVPGRKMGEALAGARVKALVLSSCRSTYAGNTTRVLQPGLDRATALRYPTFSLAREVVLSGVPCVVGMSYKALASAISTFVFPFYLSLSRGQNLSTATSEGRRALFRSPIRPGLREPVRIQDWHIPVIYQQAGPGEVGHLRFDPQVQIKGGEETDWDLLPKSPELGFFGRDDAFRELEEAFRRGGVVHLCGQAGIGKTVLAIEFVRWFVGTGGAVGRLGYFSAARHSHASSLLETIHGNQGLPVSAISDILIIDDLDCWDPEDAENWRLLGGNLALRAESGTRVLLVSRTPDLPLSGTVVSRIPVGILDPTAQSRLAASVLEKKSKSRNAVPLQHLLTKCSGGNPEFLILQARQALRTEPSDASSPVGLDPELYIPEFHDDLATTLRSSLERTLGRLFSVLDRDHLAFLYLFRSTVHLQILQGISGSKRLDLPLSGLTEEHWRSLLERCERVGLATKQTDHFFRLHPALRWYFHDRFRRLTNSQEVDLEVAFVAAVATFALMQSVHEEMGDTRAGKIIVASRENFLACYQMAIRYNMIKGIIYLAEALNSACDKKDDTWEWVVQDLARRFTTGFQVADDGEETLRTLAYRYQIELLCAQQLWSEADKVVREAVTWLTGYAGAALQRLEKGISRKEDHVISHLIILKHLQGQICDESGLPGSADIYRQTLSMARKCGDDALEASATRKLAMALSTSEDDADLFQALELLETAERQANPDRAANDAMPHYIRGQIAMGLYARAMAAKSRHDAQNHLEKAIDHFLDAIEVLPDHDTRIGYILCLALGAAYDTNRQEDKALGQYQAAMKIADRRGRERDIARVSYNLAATFYNLNRFKESGAHARRALQILKRPGVYPGQLLEDVQTLLAKLASEAQ